MPKVTGRFNLPQSKARAQSPCIGQDSLANYGKPRERKGKAPTKAQICIVRRIYKREGMASACGFIRAHGLNFGAFRHEFMKLEAWQRRRAMIDPVYIQTRNPDDSVLRRYVNR